MIKLTRLSNHVVAINPDHIRWADATPDTTLVLIGGERIIVRETLDELIERVVTFRRATGNGEAPLDVLTNVRPSAAPDRPSLRPGSLRPHGGR